MSGILASVPMYAVLAEDVGQRGAYREGYQQFLRLLASDADADDDAKGGMDQKQNQGKDLKGAVEGAEGSSDVDQKRNNLLLMTGVLTALFILGAKSHHKHC